MIGGLPATSWLLIIVAVGAGLAIEIAFLRAHRGRRAPAETEASVGGAGTAGSETPPDGVPNIDQSRPT